MNLVCCQNIEAILLSILMQVWWLIVELMVASIVFRFSPYPHEDLKA